MGRTAFVTGATGFVGSALVRRLLAAGFDVRALVRPGTDLTNIKGLTVELIKGNVRDPGSFWSAMVGCSAVFHVAADYRLWVRRPREMYKTNVDGTINVLRAAAAAGVHRIVYTSSVATLGLAKNDQPVDENTPSCLDDMIGHYKRSKFLAETEVRRLHRVEGLPAVIVNPSTPFGPGDRKPTPTGRIVVEAARGPAFVDTGLNAVHMDDVAEGHLLALERGRIGERYILGGDNLTLRDILTKSPRLRAGGRRLSA